MALRTPTGRLGFVPVRFGDDLVGGAEMLVRELADGLAARGRDVEILTGCTRDHFLEPDHYPPGVTVRPGEATVRRFPSVASRSRADRVLGNRALAAGRPLDLAAQYRWCNDDVRVPALFDHLVDHAHEYRALVFAPYLYWTTVAGARVAPERSVLLPCLHDEPTASLELYGRAFREVHDVWFLTDPEADLARRLHPDLAPSTVVGAGVHEPAGADADRFRARHGIAGPFALYAGRREAGKGFDALLDDYTTAVERHGLTLPLVLAGPGEARIPERARAHVLDVGQIDGAERDDAMAAATAVLQPSPYESFSRTMMEAWLGGAFVVANRASVVSAWHCARAGAGATYADPDELARALRRALEPDAATDGARGRAYVRREYTWPAVLDRVEERLDERFPEGAG
ncbi:MAG: glycosyltransferase family 4 protein [Actinobacteria bacterium]|nr:glycosyltransferase family 4 protein [Actinomycetota bacterium]